MSSLNNLRKLTFVIQIGFVFLLFKSPIIYAPKSYRLFEPSGRLGNYKAN